MNKVKTPKKLAIINDLTGYGRCSQAVAIPVVSVMGVQACPVPTAIFSNHLAFPTWHKYDYTSHLEAFFTAWEELSLCFDGCLCGFLGSTAQAAILSSFLEKQKMSGQTKVILDPVMGDHGRLYSSVGMDYLAAVKELVKYADILTPNLTEACLLTDMAYPEGLPDDALLHDIVEKLHRMGPKQIVITGITEEGLFHNYISSREVTASDSHVLSPVTSDVPYPTGNTLQASMYTVKAGGPSRPGTGDLFSSIIAADALQDVPFTNSVKKAADFVRICTEGSAAADIPINEGVCFENYLSLLIQK